MNVTWLYVPADQPARIDKAIASGADAVIIDLEDAVTPERKDAARESLGSWLAGLDDSPTPEVWVRVNAHTVEADLRVAGHPGVGGICVPKVSSVGDVVVAASYLGDVDASFRAGCAPLKLMLLIETARGVSDCNAIAGASSRVTILQLGEQDLRADMRLPNVSDSSTPAPIIAARNAVVLASAAHRLAQPVGPVSMAIHEAEALEAESRELRANGFGGRATIHPAQLAPVRAAFTPTEAEVDWARRVIAADTAARAEGRGVAVLDGKMIDAPIVSQARSILSAE